MTPMTPLTPSGRARPVVAVVLAGGVGTRLGAGRPKQLLALGGRTVLEVGVTAFRDSPDVDEVVVVMPPTLVDETRESFAAAGLGEVRVIAGGILRSDSAQAAIASLGERDCDVLLHDAARPLVSARIIADCVQALQTGVAVSAAVPATDTIAVVDEAGLVRSMPDRGQLRNMQTPQGFRLSVIREAYRLAAADAPGALRATDDCGVVRLYLPDVPIQLVDGSPDNLKVTHPGDLALAESLLRSRTD